MVNERDTDADMSQMEEFQEDLENAVTAGELAEFIEQFDDDAPVVLSLGGQFDVLDPDGLSGLRIGQDALAVSLNAHPIDPEDYQ